MLSFEIRRLLHWHLLWFILLTLVCTPTLMPRTKTEKKMEQKMKLCVHSLWNLSWSYYLISFFFHFCNSSRRVAVFSRGGKISWYFNLSKGLPVGEPNPLEFIHVIVAKMQFWVVLVHAVPYIPYAYMPYLTLWDKISQNLAHLEAISHKIFKSHSIFRPSYKIFYEEININHTLFRLSEAFYILNKSFWLFWGSSKVTCKNLTEFYPISLKN